MCNVYAKKDAKETLVSGWYKQLRAKCSSMQNKLLQRITRALIKRISTIHSKYAIHVIIKECLKYTLQ